MIKDAIKTLDMSTTNFPPAAVHSAISNAKNQLLTAEKFAENAKDFYYRQVARIYTKYQKTLEQNGALDFDDLLMRTTFVMRDHPEVLAELQERFHYVLIDEYQDTNHAQYVIAHALAGGHRNIASSAIRINRSTPGAGPTSRTSSISRTIIPMPRSFDSNRITAPPRPFSPSPSNSSPTIAAQGESALDRKRRRRAGEGCLLSG